MKTTLRVARAELRTLFYSPIAWFLMIVFLVQCGVVYFQHLDGVARTQELGGFRLEFLKNLTSGIFLSANGGLFATIMQNLYLYIPLLTMNLISREMNSGTIRLLYSSPIDVHEIVLGKYIAMLIYSLLLVAIISIFVLCGVFNIQHAETGMLMTALLGFYLLLCAYSAIGLFMSCLTNYQVVAAICTFVMIGILSYIGDLWQRIAFVRELTYFLSINGRTAHMLTGLVTSKDVIYFLVIVYIFLGLSIYRLRSGMESRPAAVKAGRYIAIVASALAIGYVSSIPSLIGYYDATSNHRNTLTPNAQKILAELGTEPLQVTAYSNLLDNYWFLGAPESYNQNLAAWEPYMRFKNNIELEAVRYYDSSGSPYLFRGKEGKTLKQIASETAKSMDLDLKSLKSPEEIHRIIDLRAENNRFVMQLKWKGRTTWLRVFDDSQMWPSETEVSAALKRLQQAKLPKIGFLTGNLERSISRGGDRDYRNMTHLNSFRYSLVNQGFDVDTFSLETQDIPSDISTLVVADPKITLSPTSIAKIQAYINQGGNILIEGEPGKQAIVNPLLKPLGVQLMDGMVIQESKDMAPDLVTANLTGLAASFAKPLKQKAADSQRVAMPGAAGLTYTTGGDFTIRPLLLTDAKLSWNRVKPLDRDLMVTAKSSDAESDDDAPPVVVKKIDTAAGASVGERKKKALALQNGLNEILKGSGTKEEKQQKLKEFLANFSKANAQAAPVKRMAPVKVIKPGAVVKSDGVMKPAAIVMPVTGAGAVGSAGTPGTVTFSPADGDVKGPFATAVALTRNVNGREQHIVVTGDADLMSNAELSRFNLKTANFQFNTALFSWLSNGEFPIDTSIPSTLDKRVNVTADQVAFLRIMLVWGLPAVLLVLAAVLLVRRKRR